MNRFAAFECVHVWDLLNENQRALVERGFRWCIVDKEYNRVCSMHQRQDIADRRALTLERERSRKRKAS
jgi:hypothetical protein